jgi:hypothetical protein
MAVDLAAKAIAAEIEVRKSADALIIAEQGRWYTAIIRPLLALPVVIFMWKVIIRISYRPALTGPRIGGGYASGNKGRPHPNEPREWGVKDEEIWRNFGR